MAVLALVPMKNQQSNLGYLFAMGKNVFLSPQVYYVETKL